MFGKREPQVVYVPGETKFVDRTVTEHRTVSVTEQRAPTDASVKLLREMEQAAKNQVIQAVSVGNTTFECVVQAAREDWSDLLKFRAVFKLNGKQMSTDHEVAGHDIRLKNKSKADIVAELRDKVAKVIAGEVLTDAYRDLHEILRWEE
jgi:hypothetical protein